MKDIMQDYYYITTPVYYINAKPHIGTAYTSIAADTLARFMRLDDKKVKFLTGTDEHGQKIAQTAKQQGKEIRAYTNEAVKNFQLLNNVFNLSNDAFIRTTDPNHAKVVSKIWQILQAKQQIYQANYTGWYSIRDEAFYQEQEIIDGKAPTGSEVTWVEEPCYFFKLSHWQDKLLQFYEQNPNFIAPEACRKQVINFVKNGLKDLCISRSSFNWGIPVPDNPKHVIYVWFDALINYLTYLQYDKAQTTEFDAYWSNSLHIIGKDIANFHAIYWPAILLAIDLQPPRKIFAHGWWTNSGQKISKSVGNTIDPIELAEEYGTDQIRYFLLSEVTFGKDADFSYINLKNKVNANLANDLGNLVQRVLSFVYKNNDKIVTVKHSLSKNDEEMLNKCKIMLANVRQAAKQQALHKMCSEIWSVISLANKYVDSEQPWVLKKQNPQRLQITLYVLVELIRHIAIVAQAIIPKGAAQILDQLGIELTRRQIKDLNFPLDKDMLIDQPKAIFPRIEVK